MKDFEYITANQDEIVMESFEKLADEKTKEEHMVEYLESMAALEAAMEPYKDQKRDLKVEYVEEGWLTKEEISLAVKAYRLAKNNTDMSQLIDMVEALKGKGVGGE